MVLKTTGVDEPTNECTHILERHTRINPGHFTTAMPAVWSHQQRTNLELAARRVKGRVGLGRSTVSFPRLGWVLGAWQVTLHLTYRSPCSLVQSVCSTEEWGKRIASPLAISDQDPQVQGLHLSRKTICVSQRNAEFSFISCLSPKLSKCPSSNTFCQLSVSSGFFNCLNLAVPELAL